MNNERLNSWKEIGAYLQRNEATVRRWEKKEGLPVHRHAHESRNTVHAYPSEIDAWRASRKAVPETVPPRPLWKIPAFALTMGLCLVMVGNGVRTVEAQQRGAGKANQQAWVTWDERPNSISADGRYMGFTDYSTGDLGIRDLKTGKSRRLTNTGGWGKDRDFAEFPVISPDGRQIAYAWWGDGTKDELRVIPAAGGNPKTIWQGNSPENLIPQNWSADSKQLLVLHSGPGGNHEVAILSPQDGSLRAIKPSKSWPVYASLSPDGRWIAYDPQPDKTAAKDIVVFAVDGSRETTAVQHPANDSSPVWSPDGSQILFRSDRTGQDALWSVPFDNGKIGDAQLVKADLPRVRSNLQNLWMTRDGTLYYFSVGQFISNVYVADLDANGKVSKPPVLAVERFANINGFPALSRDGQLAFARGGNFVIYGPRAEELVIHTLKTGEERVVLTEVPVRGTPKWFPDGRSILITSPIAQGKGPNLYRVDSSTGRTELLHAAAGPVRVFDLSPDGRTIFYVQALCGERFICPDPPGARLVRLEIETGRETELKRGNIWSVAVSPDGKQLAFLDQEGFIGVMPDAGGEAREVFRGPAWVGNATQPLAWTPDQRYLLFTRDARPEETGQPLLRVPVSGGPVEQMGLSMPGIQSLSVQPDGRRIYFSANSPDEVWALENILTKSHDR
jgi:Tol biopolymer transport system component